MTFFFIQFKPIIRVKLFFPYKYFLYVPKMTYPSRTPLFFFFYCCLFHVDTWQYDVIKRIQKYEMTLTRFQLFFWPLQTFFGLCYHEQCPDRTILIGWKTDVQLDDLIRPIQHVPPGKDLQWNLWKTVKNAWTGMARKRLNTVERGLHNEDATNVNAVDVG